jgi:hypothetical protein
MTMAIENQGISYIEWSAIIAGAGLACAISLVLLQFGNAIDISSTYFQRHENITSMEVLLVGLWFFVVQLISSICGGYLAGRMRSPWSNTSSSEGELRDGTHGLIVWATSTILAVIAASFIALIGAIANQHGFVDNRHLHIDEIISRKAAIIIAFGSAAGAIVSAVAAWCMGVVGGDHRDKGIIAKGYRTFRRIR